MGILQVGEHVRSWYAMTEKEILQQVLDKLDELYDGKASESYVQHKIQNWSQEPYARGTYLFDGDTDAIEKPVGDKLFFAIDYESMVQSAALSGRRAAVEAVTIGSI